MYCKRTNTDIYLNWFSHTSNTLEKRGTLKMLLNHACKLCSTRYNLQHELCYLENIFIRNNNSPR